MVDQIQLNLDVQTNIKNSLTQLNQLNDSVKSITKSTSLMTNAFEYAKGAILPLLAISSIVKIFDSMIESANVLDDTFKALSSISDQTGQNFEDLKKSAIDLSSDGLIPLEDSALALRNLLRGGLNIAQANKLLNAFKETAALGRAEGVSLADAVKNASLAFNQAASTGFNSVNVKLLRSAGLFIDIKKANEEFAKSIGSSVKNLSEFQKGQALINEILAQGEKRTGDYAKAQQDFGAGFSKISAELKILLGELGLLFTENEKVNASVGIFGKFLELARLRVQSFTGSLSDLAYESARANVQFDLINKARSLFGAETLKTTKQIEQNTNEMQLLISSAVAVKNAFGQKGSTGLLDTIKKNLDEVGVTLKGLDDKSTIDLQVNTEQLTRDLEGVQKLLKNIGESELAQVKNDYDERNRIINDSFKNELIDADKKNKLITKSNQKLAFDSIKANDEIQKRRQEAIDRAIKEGEKNPIKVIYEAIPAKVTNLFKDLGVSIGNAIPKQVPNFFNAAFDKVKGFLSGVGDFFSSLVPQGVKDFFKSTPSKKLTPEQQKEEDLAAAKIGAAGKALVGAIGQGALGAKNLISKGLEAAIGPAFGPIAGELFSVLSSGPEAVKGMVDSFTGAIPSLVENFIASIPIFVERLIVGLIDAVIKISDRLPEIIIQFAKGLVHAVPLVIEALVLGAPRFIISLIKGLPRLISALAELMPSVAVSFSTALVAQAPSIGIAVANAIVDELKGKLGSAAGGVGDFFGNIGGFVSDIGSSFSFDKGGELSGGTPFRDSIPVMAQGGELFIDRSTNNQLKDFLDANQQEKTMTDNIMFARLIEAMNRPQIVESELKFNSETFANIILKLNRQNARLA